MRDLDNVWVEVVRQGTAELFKDLPEKRGYMVRGSYDVGVVAFFVDVRGRAYPSMSSTCLERNCPEIQLDASDYDEDPTTIVFPEFKGWTIHSAQGGKTLSICLIRGCAAEELKNVYDRG